MDVDEAGIGTGGVDVAEAEEAGLVVAATCPGTVGMAAYLSPGRPVVKYPDPAAIRVAELLRLQLAAEPLPLPPPTLSKLPSRLCRRDPAKCCCCCC